MNQLVKASSASGVMRRASSRLMRHFSIRRTEQLRVRQARATAEPDKLELGETRARDYCRGLVDLSQASMVSLNRAPARREPEHCWFLPRGAR